MKNLRLLIVAVVLIAIALILKTNKQPVENQKKSDVGINLVSAEDIEKTKEVDIKFSGKQINIVQKNGEWILPDFHSFAADLNKVEELFQKLHSMETVEMVGDTKDSHQALAVEAIDKNESVKNPETVIVTLKKENHEAIKTLYLGKGRTRKEIDGSPGFGFDGQYGRLDGSDKVYLLSNYLHLIKQLKQWADKKIVSIKADKIKRIAWNPGSEKAYELKRNSASDSLVLSPMPEDHETRQSLAKSISSALSNLSYDEVIATDTPEMHPGLQKFTRVTFETFDGLKLNFKIGSGTTKLESGREMQVFRLEAGYEGSDDQVNKIAADIDAKYADIVFAVGKGRLNGILKEKDELSQKKPEKKDKKKPSEANSAKAQKVSASHILIAYKDADRSKAQRSKEEAEKLVEELLGKIKKGEDFEKLAEEYSDCPSGKKDSGSLGEFGRGVMAKEFEKTAFSLKKGEISDVVETDFGYHIIRRDK